MTLILGLQNRGLKLYKVCVYGDSELTLLYGKVKFGNFGFSIGKCENRGFLETPESWYMQTTD